MKKSIRQLTSEVLQAFAEHIGDVQHFDNSPLPDKEEIARMTGDLKVLLFPGYFGQGSWSFDSIEAQLTFRLARVYETLKTQTFREVQHTCKAPNRPCQHCDEFAGFVAQRLIEEIPALRARLDLDIKAAFKNDPAASSFDEIIFSYPGLEAIATFRLAHFLHDLGLVLIPRIMTEYAHSRTGIDIHPGATIGDGFFIDHGTGVVIGETTVIGRDVTIYQGVTLGALNFPRDAEGKVIRRAKRHPTIEDQVVIYAGATILGGETVIGRSSVIGGNVWLTESVPPFTRVTVGKPDLRISRRKEAEATTPDTPG
jgi:serine O-acetyltransferase